MDLSALKRAMAALEKKISKNQVPPFRSFDEIDVVKIDVVKIGHFSTIKRRDSCSKDQSVS